MQCVVKCVLTKIQTSTNLGHMFLTLIEVDTKVQ